MSMSFSQKRLDPHWSVNWSTIWLWMLFISWVCAPSPMHSSFPWLSIGSWWVSMCTWMLTCVYPFARGITITFCLLTLKKQRPRSRYVFWSRIDQNSCFKSTFTANLEPIIIEQTEVNNYLQTELESASNSWIPRRFVVWSRRPAVLLRVPLTRFNI